MYPITLYSSTNYVRSCNRSKRAITSLCKVSYMFVNNDDKLNLSDKEMNEQKITEII